MPLPTEPIGSIPRPPSLLEALDDYRNGRIGLGDLDGSSDEAVRDTIERFEATGSPIITDGEQRKPSFATYPLQLLPNLDPDGLRIEFADGHHRQLPLLVAGPFRYAVHADAYLDKAQRHAHRPLKQAVIAPSALSLIYPEAGIDDYPRSTFEDDLLREASLDVRRCLDRGAAVVQLDFTEGRLAVKLDPSKAVLRRFVDLNNQVIGRFSAGERERIGIHTCPGGDHHSTHSADVDYSELLPDLFRIEAGRFYIQLASERDPERVLGTIQQYRKPKQMVFVGVIDPIDGRVETAEEVRDRIVQAARFIPLDRLGTTDDCGFSPFGDDTSTSRDVAFAKIEARVKGTALADVALKI
jgi:5-methyltetrahydropteroyltriglutamate--homocysteine methyltransferase